MVFFGLCICFQIFIKHNVSFFTISILRFVGRFLDCNVVMSSDRCKMSLTNYLEGVSLLASDISLVSHTERGRLGHYERTE